tara:strand:- start:237 stop:929 length:693 start_codon:yes stop_codon:yes gene_type:complete
LGDLERQKIVEASIDAIWKDEGKKYLQYLREKRGLSDDVIRGFRFGCCPRRIEHQYRGRLIFPLYDVHDNLTAIITKDPTKTSSKPFLHEEFDKSFHLFGLNMAWKGILRRRAAIVVEGEYDVACLHSNGLDNTVATSGSAMTVFHAALLSRYCGRIFVMFDGDSAGRSATTRALKMAKDMDFQAYGVKVIPVALPKDLDPDDYIMEHGKKSVVALLREAEQRETENDFD